MSWATNKQTIVDALDGYYLIKGNRDFENKASSKTHKHYTLKPVGGQFDGAITNGGLRTSPKARLEMYYHNKDKQKPMEEKRDDNYVDFLAVCNTIKGLTGFANFVNQDFDFEDIDDTNSKATVEFYFGYYGS